jgi:cytochrome c biogenesis protein CcdA
MSHAIVLPVLCIAVSLYLFWKNRKMGESWMRNGRPNWNYVVCNGGGNLFVFGWFLFWVGFSAVGGEDGWALFSLHTQFNVSLRGACAFVSCIVIVFLTVLVEQMTDEHDEVEQSPVGRVCGRFTELLLSLGFMAAFGLYGISSYFPAESKMRIVWNSILLVVLIMQGRAYGLLYQKAIPNHDANRWSRLGRIILFAFGFLVVFQVFTRFVSMVYTLVGIVLVLLGHRHIMDDRKRGKLYLDTGKPNPAPIVYSFGPVFYSLGWIFLALAMSIPQPTQW